MTEVYNVVLNGRVIPGWDHEEVRDNLAVLFKITPEKTEWFLSGNAITIKKNIDHKKGLMLMRLLEEAGADCKLTRQDGSIPGLPVADKKDAPECSVCGIVQPNHANHMTDKPYSNSVARPSRPSQHTYQNDLSQYVDKNRQRYMELFARFDENEGAYVISWNWPAFFLTAWWFFYRKLYVWALVSIGAGILVSALAPILTLPFHIGIGVSANFLYYRHAKKKIHKLRMESPTGDIGPTLSEEGGVTYKVPACIALALMVLIFLAVVIPKLMNSGAETTLWKIDTNAVLRPTFHTTEGI
ncbi:DUF2628 domain-containing protein [Desulfoluna spongiiphila]|uniref:DUF2628 domain-containing protein n=1 Tax=Desulfoluna spongiiphila TaxID=419481 RepID=A0A1G5FEV2_9BACT|nr:DUF2628 domain-containing protein [Desulfoluna spongiiphila]SCY37775.1 Protein of unknown function [Desulfoluna spongiiphila]